MLAEDNQKDTGYLTESKGKWTKEIQEGLDEGVEIINSFPFYGAPWIFILFLCFSHSFSQSFNKY